MKRVLFIIFCILCCGVCNSAQIVNVEYIHKLIEQQYGITVPYNSNLTNPHVAANMKYLLTTIDAANSILNGEQITDYGNSEYATSVATDTDATIEMVRDHIRDYKFFATTTPDTSSFSFSISASGVFHIDWGDGTRQSYRKTNTAATTYSHEYATPGEYVIKIGGYATGYNTSGWQWAVSFINNKNLAKIDGNISAIFSTLKTSTTTRKQPDFHGLFQYCTNLGGTIPPDLFKNIYGEPTTAMYAGAFYYTKLSGEIPDGLFGNLSGPPAPSMFESTFYGCKELTGNIPENLFGDIYGAPASGMFNSTFCGCSGLTGNIPTKLFGDISGNPAASMYAGVFDDCSGLTGTIPENLFGDIYGQPARNMFYKTFRGCSGITGPIPDGLFGNLYGVPATNMFSYTFQGCSGLTGEMPENLFGNISGDAQDGMFLYTFANNRYLTGSSPKINGQYLYEIWPDATTGQVGGMFRNVTKLTDYADIPSPWK